MNPLAHLMGAQFGQGVEHGVGQGGLLLLLQPEQEDWEQGGHLEGEGPYRHQPYSNDPYKVGMLTLYR